MSWLWGIGFFYSIHVTLVYGWMAFCCFAAINAAGLFLFGAVLDRRPETPEALVAALGPRFALVLLLVQVAAVATAVFGFVAYLAEPLIGAGKGAALAVLVLLASAIGHALSIAGLRRLHAVLLVAGVGAGLVALWSFPVVPGIGRVPRLVLDGRFLGLALPSLVGFLLGPWLDLQQWRRAAAIRADGGSLTVAYGGGAFLFAALLGLNALIAVAAVGPAHLLPSADGLPDGGGAVARALAAGGFLVPAVAFAAWAGIAMATTIDSAYEASSWFLRAALGRSTSAVLALVPARLLSSPLPAILAGTALGWAAASTGLSLIYLMAPFATVFVGSAACLVCAVFGARTTHDTVLNLLLGTAAALVFLLGYVAPLPLLIAGAPLIGLIGVLPALGEVTGLSRRPAPSDRPASDRVPSIAGSAVTILQPGEGGGAGCWFQDDWFVMPIVPSYDDTNSVGNVYFANYVRWVGKARELFFNRCMPDFELKTTAFFILTRSFSHDFRREAREFDPILVRIRIAQNNRKFVTLAHEIVDRNHGLLGSGEQTLMFVDSRTSQMLDIPSSIIKGFLPYWPKGSRFAKSSGHVVAAQVGQAPSDTAELAVPRSRTG